MNSSKPVEYNSNQCCTIVVYIYINCIKNELLETKRILKTFKLKKSNYFFCFAGDGIETKKYYFN